MKFGGGIVSMITGGIAAEATGGDFSEGALTAMVVFLYNELGHIDKEFRNSMNKLQSSKAGLALIKRALRTKVEINIYAAKKSNRTQMFYSKDGRLVKANIYINTKKLPIIEALGPNGLRKYRASITRVLAHELGHAVSGLSDFDKDIDWMTIVNRFENPVMYPIDYLYKTIYDH